MLGLGLDYKTAKRRWIVAWVSRGFFQSATNLCPEASRQAESIFLTHPAFPGMLLLCASAGQGAPQLVGQVANLVACHASPCKGKLCPEASRSSLPAEVHRQEFFLHVLISLDPCCADMESPSHEGLLQLVDFWQQRLQAYEVGGVQPQASPANQAMAGPQGIKHE